MNLKDKRILKMAAKGMTIAQIAKKLGAPDDLQRVRDVIEKDHAKPYWSSYERWKKYVGAGKDGKDKEVECQKEKGQAE